MSFMVKGKSIKNCNPIKPVMNHVYVRVAVVSHFGPGVKIEFSCANYLLIS